MPIYKSSTNPEVKQALGGLLGELERTKGSAGDLSNPPGSQYVEEFAQRVFSMADDEDRGGRASKLTARNFYTASLFFQALQQFEECQPFSESVAERLRYAKWKAADITQALREGRTPQPGPPGGVADEEAELAAALGQAPSHTPAQQAPPAATSLFPSVPTGGGTVGAGAGAGVGAGGGATPSPFPSVPGGAAPTGSLFPTAPGAPPATNGAPSPASMFPSTPSTGTGASHSVPPPAANPAASLFPSAPTTTFAPAAPVTPSSFPTAPASTQPPPAHTGGAAFPTPPSQPLQPASGGFTPSSGPSLLSSMTTSGSTAPRPASAGTPPPVADMSGRRANLSASDNDVLAATKQAKFALSALQFDDIAAAVKHLQGALQLLTQ
jgi:vacuolar protein sorting-associated protein VTA1